VGGFVEDVEPDRAYDLVAQADLKDVCIWEAIILIDEALLGLRRNHAFSEIASVAKRADGLQLFARADLSDIEGFCEQAQCLAARFGKKRPVFLLYAI